MTTETDTPDTEGDIAIGSVVCLASGGPAMTVRDFVTVGEGDDAYDDVVCQWFDEDSHPLTETFPADMLVLYTDDDEADA